MIELDGEKAIDEIESKNHLNNYDDLVVAYHPQCPHCKTIVEDVKTFAKQVKEKGLALNVIGVNVSKLDGLQIDSLNI